MSFGRTALVLVVAIALGFGPSLAVAALVSNAAAVDAPAACSGPEDLSSECSVDDDAPGEPTGAPSDSPPPLPEEEEEKHVSDATAPAAHVAVLLHCDAPETAPQSWLDRLERPPRARA